MFNIGMEMFENLGIIMANNDLFNWVISFGKGTLSFVTYDEEIGYTDDKAKKATKEMNEFFKKHYQSIGLENQYEAGFNLKEDLYDDISKYTFRIEIKEGS